MSHYSTFSTFTDGSILTADVKPVSDKFVIHIRSNETPIVSIFVDNPDIAFDLGCTLVNAASEVR